jgi:hypothetical protein
MSRLLDALDVVMENMVQALHHGRRLFLVVLLEWLWRHVDTMVLVAATWSLSYHVAAFGFGYGWGEGIDVFEHLVQNGLSKAMGWLVWAYFAHSLLYPDDNEDNDDVQDVARASKLQEAPRIGA